jgi:ethanolamine ammonia-lyase large subunit
MPSSTGIGNVLTPPGCVWATYIMELPGAGGAEESGTSFYDALFLENLPGLKRAPQFEQWLQKISTADTQGQLRSVGRGHSLPAQARP